MSKRNIDWNDELDFEEKKSDNKELLRFVGRIISNWYWFVLCGAIGLTLAFIYLRYTVPSYKIYAKLLVSDDKKGGGMLGSSALGDLSSLMGTKNSVDNEVEVLKTADLMREMILEEKAYIGYFNKGRVHNVPVLSAPFEVELLSNPDSIVAVYAFEAQKRKDGKIELSNADTLFNVDFGKTFALSGVGLLRIVDLRTPPSTDSYGFRIAPLRSMAAAYSTQLSVAVTNKNVSTIDLTFEHQLPKRGEQLLETLIDKYVELNLHDKNVIADSTLAFINARLSTITGELAGVEDRISGYKRQNQLADISQQGRVLIESSADYTQKLAEVETQLAAVDAVASYLKDTQHPRVVPSAVIPQDIGFNALIQQYNELVLQRERLLLANTQDNPLVQNITSQIAGVRQDMIANVASTRRQLELARQSQQELANSVSSQINQVPTIERGYIDLARLQQIKQAQYIFLQEKWEETAIGRTANVSNSKVIDTPKAAREPFSPKRNMTYALGLVLGLVFPLGILYLKDLLNVRVQSVEDLDSRNSLPILGMIAHSDEKDQVVVSKTSRSPIAEQFRAMRTNLEFALNGGKRILFTSSMSGEGKSYVALNLAVSLALLDKKVLLMELDLRKPSVTAKLGLPAGKGFSHYIVRSEMQVEEILMPSGVHELVDLVQAGAIPPNPAELLIHPRAAELMEVLAQRYDYILMDAPPVGMVTDAQLLSRYADCCLYLVRQSYTYKEQIRLPNDLVATDKIKPIQLIINDIKARGGYYSNYGYGYGYGYGEYGKTTHKKWWHIGNKK
ncbi:GumC family protein [Sphingobacterium haloxyli]|uniref:non-specific protein-tyrosine kinase n=1 Tax=Sphingobacterium haloxyli TaxID=2100533 RepID=A0A2S9J243_9SPHI|nr:tyrosine-protein kinase [Sphingobacterium haloxyli]PRD46856.1 capsular biosynthesis protein [Sphingobacterium haloxyli]